MPTWSGNEALLRVEADARLAGEALRVEDAREDEQDDAVLRLELDASRRAPATGAASSASALAGVTSALRICPPSSPTSIRTKRRQPLATTSVRTPWTESGWTNATSRPKSPRRGVSSISCAPVALELVERRVESSVSSAT